MFEVVSLQIGRVRRGTAIDKRPVASARLSALGFEGDEQAWHKHGGPDKALLGYSQDHRRDWERELGKPLWHGAFGENLTMSGLREETACIGDVLALGGAELEIAQPRVPCKKLARHLGVPGLARRALESQRTGFYLRVRRPAEVRPGALTLVARPFPQLTVAAAVAALTDRGHPSREGLLACAALSAEYRAALLKARAPGASFG